MDITLDHAQSLVIVGLKDSFKSSLVQECLENALLFIVQTNSIARNHSQIQHINTVINTLLGNEKPLGLDDFIGIKTNHVITN